MEVLLLHRDLPASAVEAAVTKALALQAIDVQAVRQALIDTAAPPAPATEEAVTAIRVQQPSLDQYNRLLVGGGAS
ncbi:MAG: hypothetical protein IMX00_11345 [Limnochordales bacterium]|nr:hypothetical protein [Limnochordales bacterium]